MAHVLMADLIDFIEQHRPYSTLAADATEPTERGYLVTVDCSCGVAFMRWMTEAGAVSELTWSSLLSMPN